MGAALLAWLAGKVGGLSAKTAMLAIGVLAIAGVVLAGYLYVKRLSDDLVAARADVATLTAAKAVQDAAIAQAEQHAAAVAAQVAADHAAGEALHAGEISRQAQVDRLAAILTRHNLRKLSDAKPKLVEPLINRATAAAVERLRQASQPHGDHQGDRAGGTAAVPPAAPGVAGDRPAGEPVDGAAKGPARP